MKWDQHQQTSNGVVAALPDQNSLESDRISTISRKDTIDPLYMERSLPDANANMNIVPDDRIFVDRTPEELMKSVDAKMLIDQNRLAQPFLDKWMMLRIVVDDVSINPYVGTIWVDGTKMCFIFDKKWKPRLEILSHGQGLNVMGKIREITPRKIVFEDSALI